MALPPTSSAASTAVDLSRLPPPDIVEPVNYEAVLAQMTARMQALVPGFDALTSADPAIKVLEIAAYEKTILFQRVNDAARATMVGYARGADLDNLAALFGLTRLLIEEADEALGTPAVYEDDDRLRRRVLLAPDSFSVAGPATAYVFHALSAEASLVDAAASSPEPGEVVVALLGSEGDGTVAADIVEAVRQVRDFLAPHECPGLDVVMLDIAMPGRDGLDVLKQLKADIKQAQEDRAAAKKAMAEATAIREAV